MHKELQGTLDRIQIYRQLSEGQTLALATSFTDEDIELQKLVLYLARWRPWADEWLALWNKARLHSDNRSYSLAWARAHYADLAYLMQDNITDITFTRLTCVWESIQHVL